VDRIVGIRWSNRCHLEKAFDKVPHKRLITANCIHIQSTQGLSSESLLANRRQRVSINGLFSFWKEALSGIPQGSIIGPLNFTYDLVDSCNNASELFLYNCNAKLFRHSACNSDADLLQTRFTRYNTIQ